MRTIKRNTLHLALLACTACLVLLAACMAWLKEPQRFAIIYNSNATTEQLQPYDLLVFHPDNHPDLSQLHPEQTVLAYLNIGEADEGHLNEEQKSYLALKRNETWNADMIDIRHPEWQKLILDHYAKRIIQSGFDGFILDTLDNASYLQSLDPEAYGGMEQAAVSLIKQLRETYPNALIMMNRGFELWQKAAPYADMALAESTLTGYNFETQTAYHHKPETLAYYSEKIKMAKNHFPHLKIYSVDYWDITDVKGVKNIYRQQRKKGLIPYVSTPMLDAIHAEPTA